MNQPTITSANAALYFASARRAAVLFTEGRYTWTYEETDLNAVKVRKPEYPFGEVSEYTVNALAGTCDCPQFEKHGFCKHQLAIAELLSEEVKWRLICDEVDAQTACEMA